MEIQNKKIHLSPITQLKFAAIHYENNQQSFHGMQSSQRIESSRNSRRKLSPWDLPIQKLPHLKARRVELFVIA